MASESWGVIQQPNFTGASWENSPMGSKSNNLPAGNWETQPPTGNWGNERPSVSAPSENNLSARKPVQGSWGQNKSENSWAMRNEDVQVDQSTWKRNEEPPTQSAWKRNEEPPTQSAWKRNEEPPTQSAWIRNEEPPTQSTWKRNEEPPTQSAWKRNEEPPTQSAWKRNEEPPTQSTWKRNEEPPTSISYKNNKRENEEEKLDVGIQQSFETLKNDGYERQIVLDEDDYNPSYESYPTSSKQQLSKSIVSPFDDEIQYNDTSVLSRKVFRDVEVQTDPIDLAAISTSNEKLLSCTISSPIKKEYQQTSPDYSVSEKRYPPQQPSLLDVGPEEWNNTKVTNSWNTSSGNPNFREGTAAIPHTRSDSSSRGEVTQLPKPNSDSWDNKPTSVQNDSWNSGQRTSARNDNRDTVPKSIPPEPDSWDSGTRNDNRGTVPKSIPPEPDSWDSGTRNDNRSTVPKSIPPGPDSWDSGTRNDNRSTVPKSIPPEPDSWDSGTRNDNRGTVPKSIPPEPDSWDSGTRNDNRGTVPKSIPPEPDSWDSGMRNDNRGTVSKSIPPGPDSLDSGNRGTVPKSDSWNNRGTVPQAIPPVEPDSWDSAPKTSAQNEQNKSLPSWNTTPQPSQDNSWGSGQQQPTASGPLNDWTKKAEMYSKELGEKNEIKAWGQTKNTIEDSIYGTGASDSYYDNSSSNNRSGGRSCHNCGQEGHFVRDCPDKKQSNRGCHKCGKEGHFARDCTEESGSGYGGYSSGKCHKCGKEGHFVRDCTEESGGGYGGYGGGYGGVKPCHKCGKEGHLARDCKEDAYETTRGNDGYGGGNCYKCKQPGHRASECTEEPERSREFNNSGPSRPYMNKPSPFSNPEQPNISSQDAWDKVLKAADENDTFDFKEALESYAKVTPGETFVSIERKLRVANSNGRIIAFERPEIPLTKVLVDLQGNTNKKYVATPTCVHPSRLPRTSGNRANSEQENLDWLADSGFMVDDRSPICFNCKQKGHITKDCTEPKREIEKQPYLMCQNCNSPDHMTKYCPEDRRDYYAEARDRKAAGSYKGGSMEYSATEDRASSGYDGEEDRKGYRGYGGQTCHNCHREGHISRDCPEPKRGGGRKCNKCGEEGHMSKDCPGSSGGDYDRGNYNSRGGWQRDSSSRNNDRAASQDKGGDNTWNKPSNDNNYQENSWNKPRGGSSSRGDFNQDNSFNKTRNDNFSQDNWNKSRGDNSSRGDFNQNSSFNKTRNDNYSQDSSWNKSRGGNSSRDDYNQDNNSWNKTKNDNYFQDNKLRGGNASHDGYNHDNSNNNYSGNKSRDDNSYRDDNNNNKDSSWSSQNKAEDISQQKENQPAIIVEKDSWDSNPVAGNTANQSNWGTGNMTAADFGWVAPKENVSSAPRDFESGRGRGSDQRERTPASENYDNRNRRGNDQRERMPASENYDNRNRRVNEQSGRTPSSRGYEHRERTPSENYENRRSRANEPRDERYNKGSSYMNSRTHSNDANNKSSNLDQKPWW